MAQADQEIDQERVARKLTALAKNHLLVSRSARTKAEKESHLSYASGIEVALKDLGLITEDIVHASEYT